ncbi:MAG: methyltransferase, partial [Streptomyces sp.]|nr:methyltransferase [Streptomyces sp.]
MITTLSGETSRLSATVDFVKEHDTTALLPLLLPGLDGPELRGVAEQCRFSHAALLVFPSDERELGAMLADCGLAVEAPSRPSVVVRERLAVRHRRPVAELSVGILRPEVVG